MKAVAGLAEIVLWTHDMDRSLAFYRDLFGLGTAPVEFHLAPGESRAVVVHVALPPEPTSGPRPAGSVAVRGHGDGDLVVRVRAVAEAAPTGAAPGPSAQAAASEP